MKKAPNGRKAGRGPSAAHDRNVKPAVAGALSAKGLRFVIVVSRFNQFITERLLQSAIDGLRRLGAAAEDIELIRVPGAFEIPAAAKKAAAKGRYDAVLCIGAILRGETPHFDAISREVARGIGQAALDTGVPHSFGVLTCDTLEQAIDRAGLKSGNKGFEAALAAVEMANLFSSMGQGPRGKLPRAGKRA
jgi:6,7-dimethyl-8-ribityllumazine synthase